MSCLKQLQRFFSGVVAVTFFATNTLTPVPVAHAANVESPAFISSFTIPAEFGKVTDRVKGSEGGSLLIHIQEAHANYDAQKNIKNILEHLSENYGIRLVLLEGAGNKLTPELFNFFPQEPRLQQAINEKLMQAGELTGAETFMISKGNDQKAEAWGVEKAETYAKNREAFKRVFEGRKLAQDFLETFYRQWQTYSSLLMSKPLKEFLTRETAFEEGRLPLADWTVSLKTAAARNLKLNLDHVQEQKDWPVLVRYFRLKAIDPKIDAVKVDVEKKAFLKEIRKNMTHSSGTGDRKTSAPNESLLGEVEQVFEQAKKQDFPAYKTRFVFERLLDQLPKDFSFDPFPNLRLYLQQIILLSEIQSDALQDEIKSLTGKLTARLIKTEQDRQFTGILKDFRLIKKLFELELSRSEYQSILSDKITLEKLLQELQAQDPKAKGQNRNPSPKFLRLQSLYGTAIRFYEGAIEREDRMIERAFARMQERKQTKAVLITGGFHTEGLKEKALRAGSSYVEITPCIGEIKPEDKKNYLTALLGGKAIETSQIAALVRSDMYFLEEVFPKDWRRKLAELGTNLLGNLRQVVSSERARKTVSDFLANAVGVPASQPAAVRSETRAPKRDIIDTMPDLPGLTLGIPLDIGSERRGTAIVEFGALKKAARLLEPLRKSFGMGRVYPYNNLFATGDISPAVHQVPNKGEHFLISGNGKTTVMVRGYETKSHELDGLTLRDGANNFSITSMLKLNPRLSDSEAGPGTVEQTEKDVRAFNEKAHSLGIKTMADFIPWLTPDAIDENNLDWTFHERLIPAANRYFRSLSEEKKQTYINNLLREKKGAFFARRMGQDDEEEVVLIRHFPGMGEGNYNADQVLLNIFSPGVQDYYKQSLKFLKELGFDAVRGDMGSYLLKKNLVGFFKAADLDPEAFRGIDPLREILKDASMEVVFEAYDPDDQEALIEAGAPSPIAVYDNNLFKILLEFSGNPFVGADKIGKIIEEVLLYGVRHPGTKKRFLLYPTNFDQNSLNAMAHYPEDLGKGFSVAGVLALSFVTAYLAKDLGVLLMLRDALGQRGDVRPIVGGDITGRHATLRGEHAKPFVSTAEELAIRTDIGKLERAIREAPVAKFKRELMAAVKGSTQNFIRLLDNASLDRVVSLGWRTEKGEWVVFAVNLRPRQGSLDLRFVEFPVPKGENVPPEGWEAKDALTGERLPIVKEHHGGAEFPQILGISFKDTDYRLIVLTPKEGGQRSEVRAAGPFLGSFTIPMDDKKRLKLPARFKKLVGEKAVLIGEPEENPQRLRIYDLETWQKLIQEARPQDPVQARSYDDQVYSRVLVWEVDKQGRVTLGDAFRRNYLDGSATEFIVAGAGNSLLVSPARSEARNFEIKRIVHIAYEMAPFFEVGGVKDVLREFVPVFKRAHKGINVSVILPAHKSIWDSGLPIEKVQSFEIHTSLGNVKFTIFKTELENVTVFFIGNPDYFQEGYDETKADTFWEATTFSRAAVEAMDVLALHPDIVQAHDAQTALVIPLMRFVKDRQFFDTATVYTIHNLGVAYQLRYPMKEKRHQLIALGIPAKELDPMGGLEFYGQVNPAKAGIIFSDKITTVSKDFRDHTLTPEGGFELQDVLRSRSGDYVGIMNALDTKLWNPAEPFGIYGSYSADDLGPKRSNKESFLLRRGFEADLGAPLIVAVSRIREQKGIDWVLGASRRILRSRSEGGLGALLSVVGTGDAYLENEFSDLETEAPGRFKFLPLMGRKIVLETLSAADIGLVPSRFEPAGIIQQQMKRYGVVPVVRATGGHISTVEDPDESPGQGTGFRFGYLERLTQADIERVDLSKDLYLATARAANLYSHDPEGFTTMQKRAMKSVRSWDEVVPEYMEVYKGARTNRFAFTGRSEARTNDEIAAATHQLYRTNLTGYVDVGNGEFLRSPIVKNSLVLLIKPSIGPITPRTIDEILLAAKGRGYFANAVHVVSAGDIREQKIMEKHYPRHTEVATKGWAALNEKERGDLKGYLASLSYSKKLLETDNPVFSAAELMKKTGLSSEALARLWAVSGTVQKFAAAARAFHIGLITLPKGKNIPEHYRGATIPVLNGFLPALMKDFTEAKHPTVAIWLKKDPGAARAATLQQMKEEFAGETDPEEAAQKHPDSLRGRAFRNDPNLGLSGSKMTSRKNFIHLTAPEDMAVWARVKGVYTEGEFYAWFKDLLTYRVRKFPTKGLKAIADGKAKGFEYFGTREGRDYMNGAALHLSDLGIPDRIGVAEDFIAGFQSHAAELKKRKQATRERSLFYFTRADFQGFETMKPSEFLKTKGISLDQVKGRNIHVVDKYSGASHYITVSRDATNLEKELKAFEKLNVTVVSDLDLLWSEKTARGSADQDEAVDKTSRSEIRQSSDEGVKEQKWAAVHTPRTAKSHIYSRQWECGLPMDLLEEIEKLYGAYAAGEISMATLTGGLGALMPDLFEAWAAIGLNVTGIHPLWNFIKNMPLKGLDGQGLRKLLGKIAKEQMEDTGIKFDVSLNVPGSPKPRVISFRVYKTQSMVHKAPQYYLDAYTTRADGQEEPAFLEVYDDTGKREIDMAFFRDASERLIQILEKDPNPGNVVLIDHEVYVSLPIRYLKKAKRVTLNHTVFRPGLWEAWEGYYEMLNFPEWLRSTIVHDGLISIADFTAEVFHLITGVNLVEHLPALLRNIFRAAGHRVIGFYDQAKQIRSTNGIFLPRWQSREERTLIERGKKKLSISKPEHRLPAEANDRQFFEALDKNPELREQFKVQQEWVGASDGAKLLIWLRQKRKFKGASDWLGNTFRAYKEQHQMSDAELVQHLEEMEALISKAALDDAPEDWLKLEEKFAQARDLILGDPMVCNVRRQVPYKGPDKYEEILAGLVQQAAKEAGLSNEMEGVRPFNGRFWAWKEGKLDRGAFEMLKEKLKGQPAAEELRKELCRVLIGGRTFDLDEAHDRFLYIRFLTELMGLEDRIGTLEDYTYYEAQIIARGAQGAAMLSDEDLEASATFMMKVKANRGEVVGPYAGSNPEVWDIRVKATGEKIEVLNEKGEPNTTVITQDILREKLRTGEWEIRDGIFVAYNDSEKSTQVGGGRRPSARSLSEALKQVKKLRSDPATRRERMYYAISNSWKVDMVTGQAMAHAYLIENMLKEEEEREAMFEQLRFESSDYAVPMNAHDFGWKTRHPFERYSVQGAGLFGWFLSFRHMKTWQTVRQLTPGQLERLRDLVSRGERGEAEALLAPHPSTRGLLALESLKHHAYHGDIFRYLRKNVLNHMSSGLQLFKDKIESLAAKAETASDRELIALNLEALDLTEMLLVRMAGNWFKRYMQADPAKGDIAKYLREAKVLREELTQNVGTDYQPWADYIARYLDGHPDARALRTRENKIRSFVFAPAGQRPVMVNLNMGAIAHREKDASFEGLKARTQVIIDEQAFLTLTENATNVKFIHLWEPKMENDYAVLEKKDSVAESEMEVGVGIAMPLGIEVIEWRPMELTELSSILARVAAGTREPLAIDSLTRLIRETRADYELPLTATLVGVIKQEPSAMDSLSRSIREASANYELAEGRIPANHFAEQLAVLAGFDRKNAAGLFGENLKPLMTLIGLLRPDLLKTSKQVASWDPEFFKRISQTVAEIQTAFGEIPKAAKQHNYYVIGSSHHGSLVLARKDAKGDSFFVALQFAAHDRDAASDGKITTEVFEGLTHVIDQGSLYRVIDMLTGEDYGIREDLLSGWTLRTPYVGNLDRVQCLHLKRSEMRQEDGVSQAESSALRSPPVISGMTGVGAQIISKREHPKTRIQDEATDEETIRDWVQRHGGKPVDANRLAGLFGISETKVAKVLRVIFAEAWAEAHRNQRVHETFKELVSLLGLPAEQVILLLKKNLIRTKSELEAVRNGRAALDAWAKAWAEENPFQRSSVSLEELAFRYDLSRWTAALILNSHSIMLAPELSTANDRGLMFRAWCRVHRGESTDQSSAYFARKYGLSIDVISKSLKQYDIKTARNTAWERMEDFRAWVQEYSQRIEELSSWIQKHPGQKELESPEDLAKMFDLYPMTVMGIWEGLLPGNKGREIIVRIPMSLSELAEMFGISPTSVQGILAEAPFKSSGRTATEKVTLFRKDFEGKRGQKIPETQNQLAEKYGISQSEVQRELEELSITSGGNPINPKNAAFRAIVHEKQNQRLDVTLEEIVKASGLPRTTVYKIVVKEEGITLAWKDGAKGAPAGDWLDKMKQARDAATQRSEARTELPLGVRYQDQVKVMEPMNVEAILAQLSEVIRGAEQAQKRVLLRGISANPEEDELFGILGFTSMQSRQEVERQTLDRIITTIKQDKETRFSRQGSKLTVSTNGNAWFLRLDNGTYSRTFESFIGNALKDGDARVRGIQSFESAIEKNTVALRDPVKVEYGLSDIEALVREAGVDAQLATNVIVTQAEYEGLPAAKPVEKAAEQKPVLLPSPEAAFLSKILSEMQTAWAEREAHWAVQQVNEETAALAAWDQRFVAANQRLEEAIRHQIIFRGSIQGKAERLLIAGAQPEGQGDLFDETPYRAILGLETSIRKRLAEEQVEVDAERLRARIKRIFGDIVRLQDMIRNRTLSLARFQALSGAQHPEIQHFFAKDIAQLHFLQRVSTVILNGMDRELAGFAIKLLKRQSKITVVEKQGPEPSSDAPVDPAQVLEALSDLRTLIAERKAFYDTSAPILVNTVSRMYGDVLQQIQGLFEIEEHPEFIFQLRQMLNILVTMWASDERGFWSTGTGHSTEMNVAMKTRFLQIMERIMIPLFMDTPEEVRAYALGEKHPPAPRSEMRTVSAAATLTPIEMVTDMDPLIEKNVLLDGGGLQGFRGVTEKITDGIWSLTVNSLHAVKLAAAFFFPTALAQETFDVASVPATAHEQKRFVDARKVLLGGKILGTSDVLILAPEFGVDLGAALLMRKIVGDSPVAVLVRNDTDRKFLDQINSRLRQANQPLIFPAATPEEAAQFLGRSVRGTMNIKPMVSSGEKSVQAGLLLQQYGNAVITVTPKMYQNFLNLTGVSEVITRLRDEYLATARSA
ncbi:MAG: glycogen/starch synthase [Candidatus Omnitrophota bacterium]